MPRRANYALVYFGVALGPEAGALDLDWATYAAEESDGRTFAVPTGDVCDAYLSLQAYDVGEYDHEVLLNGEPLGGVDLPPSPGWQHWMDAFADVRLREGANTLAVRRDPDSEDSFAVGNAVVHWKEPVTET